MSSQARAPPALVVGCVWSDGISIYKSSSCATNKTNTNIITAANTSTNISVGFVGGAATALVNAYTIGTTAGRQYPETKAGGALAWEDIGTSDQRLNFTNSAATNAGEVRITVLYQQNTNYA